MKMTDKPSPSPSWTFSWVNPFYWFWKPITDEVKPILGDGQKLIVTVHEQIQSQKPTLDSVQTTSKAVEQVFNPTIKQLNTTLRLIALSSVVFSLGTITVTLVLTISKISLGSTSERRQTDGRKDWSKNTSPK
jgi:hypothetical protein